jgi:hypothetical protein
MTMPGPRRDVLTVIGATLTAALSANLPSFHSPDSPDGVHTLVGESVCAHG